MEKPPSEVLFRRCAGRDSTSESVSVIRRSTPQTLSARRLGSAYDSSAPLQSRLRGLRLFESLPAAHRNNPRASALGLAIVRRDGGESNPLCGVERLKIHLGTWDLCTNMHRSGISNIVP